MRRDFADIGEDGVCVAGFWRNATHYATVVAVHCKSVFVEVYANGYKFFRQKEGIASHAAAKVVYDGGAFATVLVRLASAFPKRSFPTSDILGGALFQSEFVTKEERGTLDSEFFAKFWHESHIVHNGGSIFVAEFLG